MKANKSEKVGSKPFFDMCTYVDALKLCEVVWKEEFASENKKWRIDWENVLKHLPSHRTASEWKALWKFMVYKWNIADITEEETEPTKLQQIEEDEESDVDLTVMLIKVKREKAKKAAIRRKMQAKAKSIPVKKKAKVAVTSKNTAASSKRPGDTSKISKQDTKTSKTNARSTKKAKTSNSTTVPKGTPAMKKPPPSKAD